MDPQLVNDIISTSVGGAAGGAVAGLVLYGVQNLHTLIREKIESKRIYEWMQTEAGESSGWRYRSTRTIASYNNLTEDRVRFLCSSDIRITQARGDAEDLWTLNAELEQFKDVQRGNP